MVIAPLEEGDGCSCGITPWLHTVALCMCGRGGGQLWSTIVCLIMHLSESVLGQFGSVQHGCICIIGLHHLYK